MFCATLFGAVQAVMPAPAPVLGKARAVLFSAAMIWLGVRLALDDTISATVPLTIDYWRQQGKVKRGDRILASVFGSGFTWGAAIFTL